jgi:hypothetical protein
MRLRVGSRLRAAPAWLGRYSDGIKFANGKEISLQALGSGVTITLVQAEEKAKAVHERENVPGPVADLSGHRSYRASASNYAVSRCRLRDLVGFFLEARWGS